MEMASQMTRDLARTALGQVLISKQQAVREDMLRDCEDGRARQIELVPTVDIPCAVAKSQANRRARESEAAQAREAQRMDHLRQMAQAVEPQMAQAVEPPPPPPPPPPLRTAPLQPDLRPVITMPPPRTAPLQPDLPRPVITMQPLRTAPLQPHLPRPIRPPVITVPAYLRQELDQLLPKQEIKMEAAEPMPAVTVPAAKPPAAKPMPQVQPAQAAKPRAAKPMPPQTVPAPKPRLADILWPKGNTIKVPDVKIRKPVRPKSDPPPPPLPESSSSSSSKTISGPRRPADPPPKHLLEKVQQEKVKQGPRRPAESPPKHLLAKVKQEKSAEIKTETDSEQGSFSNHDLDDLWRENQPEVRRKRRVKRRRVPAEPTDPPKKRRRVPEPANPPKKAKRESPDGSSRNGI